MLSDGEHRTGGEGAAHVALRAGDRVVVIANPGTRARLDRVMDALREGAPSGVSVETMRTTRQGDGRELSLKYGEGARLLIAVGGDGTVGEVAEGAVAHKVPLAIIPGGSTNIIGRELGVPSSSERAIALIFGRHRLRTIDVGRANDLLFLHMAGAGIDSLMFDLTNPQWKKRVGWMAYVPAAARALARPSPCFQISAEDHELRERAPLVLVANGSAIIHPRIQLDPTFELDDGWLDLMVATPTTPIALARTLGRLATLQLRKSPYIQRVPARRIEIASDPPVPFQIDGDVVLQTPVTVTILPLAVRILVPA